MEERAIGASRRQVLAGAGALGVGGAIAMLAGPLDRAQAAQPRKPRPGQSVDVVVLGAGMAGIKAAHDLVQAGKSVVVLEARDRIGGRLFTDHSFTSVPVELGAELLHGPNIPTWELIRAVGAETVPANADRNVGPPMGVPGPSDFDFASAPEPYNDENAYDYLMRIGFTEDKWTESFWMWDIDTEPFKYQSAKSYYDSDAFAGTAEEDIGQTGTGDIFEFDDWRTLGGYDQIFEPLIGSLDIRLRSAVREVARNRDGVEVRFNNRPGRGNGNAYGRDETIQARACVVALPVGVLQRDVTFSPALPDSHQAALRGLGMVTAFHPVFEFDRPVIPADVTGLWDTTQNPPSWWSSSRGYSQLTGEIITGWACGDNARELLDRGDDYALRESVKAIRHMVGDPSLTPIRSRVHNWSADPYARGAYTFIRPGGQGSKQALAASVSNQLFFAGEATRSGTVHGAFQSGQRAAKEALTVLG